MADTDKCDGLPDPLAILIRQEYVDKEDKIVDPEFDK